MATPPVPEDVRPSARGALTVLIADDEQLARDRLRAAVTALPDFEVVAECEDGISAVNAIDALTPDLVLLDVEMPGLGGFGVIQRLGPPKMPMVVFVTAFDYYAVKAFESGAIDYILKPFENDRVRDVLARAREHIDLRSQGEVARQLALLLADLSPEDPRPRARNSAEHSKRLTVREDDRFRFIAVAEIDWIESEGNYLRIHIGDREHRVRDSLASLSERLDPQQFARIHKSTMVNIDRIAEVQPWFGGDYVAILRDGKQLRVSRTFAHSLLKSR